MKETLILVLILLFSFLLQAKADAKKIIEKTKRHIILLAKEHNFEPEFIFKLISAESSWNPKAVSPLGYRGLMQLGEAALSDYNRTHRTYYTIDDLFDPYINTKVGIWYLSWIRDNFTGPNLRDMLIAYHDGVGNYMLYKKGERKLGPQVKIYLRKILGN